MAKRTNDLVPYRRLHFFAPVFAPLTHRGQVNDIRARPDAAEPLRLAAQLFAAVSSRCGDRPHVIMAAVATFRGSHLRCTGQPDVLSRRMVAAAGVRRQRFLFPDNVKSTVCAVPSTGIPLSGTLVANTTAVLDLFDCARRRCVYALTKRERLHSFVTEGMTADDFYHALEKIDSLIEEYRSIDRMIDDNDRVVGE
ncbi:tubulin beta-8 chain-like protein [Sipha flava]|uniref:Tubulin beta-8 chain-like protein n=1 Tax=Sipha flava TaxID=143950 RepID=A0A8B8F6X9_9HEMI|nr:tubulin beta-8 chain-like protein [Sipha flava]